MGLQWIFEVVGDGHTAAPAGASSDTGLGPTTGALPLALGPGASDTLDVDATRVLVFEESDGSTTRTRMRCYRLKKNDTQGIVAQLKSNGSAVDLTTFSSGTLTFYDQDGSVHATQHTLDSDDIVSASSGTIRLTFDDTPALVATAGTFWATIAITWSDTTVRTYPNAGGVLVIVEDV